MDCFHLMFFPMCCHCYSLLCTSSGGRQRRDCKLQIANRGNSWNQIIVFEDVFHFEVFDPCIILRSQNSESISPMVLLIHTEDWVVPKFYDQLQPFFLPLLWRILGFPDLAPVSGFPAGCFSKKKSPAVSGLERSEGVVVIHPRNIPKLIQRY